MKNIILLIVFIAAVTVGYAQSNLEMADSAFSGKEYLTALSYYQKAMSKSSKLSSDPELKYKVAECYRYTGKGDDAIKWYDDAKAAGYTNPNYLYHEGGILLNEGKYTEAKEKLNAFLALQPNDKDATRMLNSCNFAVSTQQEPSVYTVKNEASLNTVYSEYGSTPVKDNIIFTSSRLDDKGDNVYSYDGQGYSDLFQSGYSATDKQWSKAQKVAALNSPFNDGVFSYCEKTKTGYFTKCNDNKSKTGACTIVESTCDDNSNTWSAPKPIHLSFIQKFDIEQPSVSADGNKLYFASRRDGGKGGSDIWVMMKNGDEWGEPQNLGEQVNTEFDEMFPVSYHDSVLYFSSEGYIGYGGLDLYSTTYSNGTWSKPVNLKAPFNSNADDFLINYNADKSAGTFSSDRPGGAGSDDIYSFFLTPVILTVKGRVTDMDGEKPLVSAMVTLTTKDGVDTTYTNANGEYMFNLDKDKDYKINVQNPGYFGDSRKLTTQGEQYSKEFSKATGHNYDFSIKKIPKEEIKIDNIYYDYDSYTLREESKPSLDKLVKLLEDTPNAMVQINSHTDERGQLQYNMKLSENRAKSVVDYLVEHGISQGRLSWKGFGPTQPVIKNAKTEEEHQQNRRTTFQVLKND